MADCDELPHFDVVVSGCEYHALILVLMQKLYAQFKETKIQKKKSGGDKVHNSHDQTTITSEEKRDLVSSKMGSSSSKPSKEDTAFVDNEVQGQQVVIWSKTYCSYCAATKNIFRQPEFKGLDVKVHELNSMSNGNAIQNVLLSKTGQRTVPSVWINGKFLGGNSETQSALRNGKLKSMLTR